MDLVRIIANASPAQIRHEELDGRKYIAVPMIMLQEGVLSGSGGPTYYPPKEIAKVPTGWNAKPVVVYHPTVNGQGVSATANKTILEKYQIGMIMNTRWENKQLKAEAWIDEAKANKVDKRVMEAIRNNQMVEVSTGLFSDTQPVSGTWNNKHYDKIAVNYVPDHLAVLPDKKGALSIEDGAGLLRNADETFNKVEDKVGDDSQTVINNIDDDSQDDVTNSNGVADISTNDMSVDTMDAVNPNIEVPFSMSKTKLIASISEKLNLNSEEAGKLNDLPESLLEKTFNELTKEVPAPEPFVANSLADLHKVVGAEILPIVNEALKTVNDERATKVKDIVANSKMTSSFCENLSLEDLRSLHASLVKNDDEAGCDKDGCDGGDGCDDQPTGNEQKPAKFVGLAGVTGIAAAPITNDDPDFDMIPKGIDFSKK